MSRYKMSVLLGKSHGGTSIGFESKLRKTAGKLRGHMSAAGAATEEATR